MNKGPDIAEGRGGGGNEQKELTLGWDSGGPSARFLSSRSGNEKSESLRNSRNSYNLELICISL